MFCDRVIAVPLFIERPGDQNQLADIELFRDRDAVAHAFDPPVDQQGPLTVRIDGPARITDTESPFYVSVNLKNSAKQSVIGKLRLSGIDQWKCDPHDAVSFAVGAESESTIRFQVMPDRGTFQALYPLHARAEFQWQNKQYIAHPILIAYADVQPEPPAATARAWAPLVIETDRSLALRQLPHRGVIEVFGGQRETMPPRWTGSADSNRASIDIRENFQVGDSLHNVIAIHPPWADGQVGTAWIEYPLSLPRKTPILLRFATAVTPTVVGMPLRWK